MGSRWVNTVGTTFKNADGSSRQEILSEMVGTNRHVYLLDASSGEHPEAIAVYNDEWQQIGFVPKDMARSIRNKGIDVDEISISRCRCYKWNPEKRKSYGDDFEHQGQELYGCKFVIEHDLIDGDADDYDDDFSPVRSLEVAWDGSELHRIDELDNEQEDEEQEIAKDEDVLLSNEELEEYIKRIQRIQAGNENEHDELDREAQRQNRSVAVTIGIIVVVMLALMAVGAFKIIEFLGIDKLFH